MNTRVSIKSRAATPGLPGFDLYVDAMDYDSAEALASEPPVYLALEQVRASVDVYGRGSAVTLCLPQDAARALGLLPPLRPVPSCDDASDIRPVARLLDSTAGGTA
jgi:hypothetical protein